MQEAVIERTDLARINFCFYELWQLGPRGQKIAQLQIAPAHMDRGEPTRTDLAAAKVLLTTTARQHELTLVHVPPELH